MKRPLIREGNMKIISTLLAFVCGGLWFSLLITSCGPKAPQLILDAESQYTLAKGEYEKQHWDKALVELQKLVLNYPGVNFIDSAQYLLGMTYFNQKEYPSAINEFNRLLTSFPTSSLADDAAFKVAECDFRMSPRAELDQTHTQKALDELKNFLDDYPLSDKREKAQRVLEECRSKLAKKVYQGGYLYYKLRRYDAAALYFKQVLDEYQDTEWSKLSQFYLAEALYQGKKYDQAKEGYQKFIQDFPQDELAKKATKNLEKTVRILASEEKEKTAVETKDNSKLKE
jgi:outer membrane protein assembly factor BamD